MIEKCRKIAKEFVECCRSGKIRNEPFEFFVNEFIFGTILIENFDSIIFLTAPYGLAYDENVYVLTPSIFVDTFDDICDDDYWKDLYIDAVKYFSKIYIEQSDEVC